MSKGRIELFIKRRTILGMGHAHPYLCPCLGPSLLVLGSWDTHLGHSIVVGWVLGALVIVALQGLGKDVVSEILFLKTYDFLGMSTTAHLQLFLGCCCCDCMIVVDVLHHQGAGHCCTMVIASSR